MEWIILPLRNVTLKCLRDYEEHKKSVIPREKITFNPIKLGMKSTDFWIEKSKENSK